MEKQEVFVLGFNEVDFTNRETGELVKGTSVYYVDPSANNVRTGLIPAKTFLQPGEETDVVQNGPGFYNLLIEIQLQGNRPKIRVKGFEIVEPKQLDFKSKSAVK